MQNNGGLLQCFKSLLMTCMKSDLFVHVNKKCMFKTVFKCKQEKSNFDISAASFCCKVAALAPTMFCSFYLLKNHKLANNSTTTEAGVFVPAKPFQPSALFASKAIAYPIGAPSSLLYPQTLNQDRKSCQG